LAFKKSKEEILHYVQDDKEGRRFLDLKMTKEKRRHSERSEESPSFSIFKEKRSFSLRLQDDSQKLNNKLNFSLSYPKSSGI
jgi:hypothetical protein